LVTNVVSLRGGKTDGVGEPPQSNEALIECLRRMLASAESGDFIGIAAVLLGETDNVGYCFGGRLRYYTTIGGIEEMKHEFVAMVEDVTGNE
jgi:hypothetical protein